MMGSQVAIQRIHPLACPLTFLISAMISLGSLEDVVFMLHVKRSERGFTSPGMPPTPPSLTALLK